MPKYDEAEHADWWPCGCFKGGGKGRPSTHIKLHAPDVQRCRRCGTTKEQHDALAKRMRDSD